MRTQTSTALLTAALFCITGITVADSDPGPAPRQSVAAPVPVQPVPAPVQLEPEPVPAEPMPVPVPFEPATATNDVVQVRSAASLERLFFRIRKAAAELCRIDSYAVGYVRWEEHRCETDAVARAVRDLGIPALSDYYFGGAELKHVARR